MMTAPCSADPDTRRSSRTSRRRARSRPLRRRRQPLPGRCRRRGHRVRPPTGSRAGGRDRPPSVDARSPGARARRRPTRRPLLAERRPARHQPLGLGAASRRPTRGCARRSVPPRPRRRDRQRGRAVPAPDPRANPRGDRHEGQDDHGLAPGRDPRRAAGLPTSWAATSARRWSSAPTSSSPTTWAVLELSELQLPTIGRGADVARLHEHRRGPSRPPRHGGCLPRREGAPRRADRAERAGRPEPRRPRVPRSRRAAAAAGRCVVRARASRAAPSWRPGSMTTDGDRGWGAAPAAARGAASRPPHARQRARSGPRRAPWSAWTATAIAAAFRAFRGVPHRLEPIAELDGMRWVNDSQATIPVAAIAALEAFDAPIVLIAGGKDKGLDVRSLRRCDRRRAFARRPDRRDRRRARARASMAACRSAGRVDGRGGAPRPRMTRSPATSSSCRRRGASFDMFVDYAARGDAFRAAVAGLEERPMSAVAVDRHRPQDRRAAAV